MQYAKDYKKGVLVKIIVKPNSSSKKFIQEINDEYILLNLNSPPQDGRANKELIKRLSKLLKITSGKITIVSGVKSKEKSVYIEMPLGQFIEKIEKEG